MVSQQKSKASSQTAGKEIDALLKRLHSGCRFILFEDTVNNKHDISNALRNAAQPDEVHSELGRALAHSYIESLDDDLGERILLALCCGEDIESNNSSSNGNHLTGKANYGSAANAFFSYLAEYVLAGNNNGDVYDASSNQDKLQQICMKWLQWCVRCEELIFPTDGSFNNNGGGRSVLLACLKHYSSICFGKSLAGGCDKVYRSLTCSTSRKYWIRSIATALGSAITLTEEWSEGASVLFEEFHPLFEACIHQARGEVPLHDLAAHNEESRLILNESLRICEMNLHTNRSLSRFAMIMIEYLAVSLVSYLDQLVCTSTNPHESVVVLELSYEWLRGLTDLIQTAAAKDLDEDSTKSLITAIDAIVATILPQLSSSICSFIVAFELTSIYATIASSINSLELYSTFTTLKSAEAMRLGTIALSLESDREINAVCELLLSIFSCVSEEKTLVAKDVSFVGGILYALGCVFSSRPNCTNKALMLKRVGETLVKISPTVIDSSVSSLRGGESCERLHLIDFLSEMKSESPSSTTKYQQLVEVISGSISDVDETNLHSWRRRPLALEDQCSGLLVGLSFLHISALSPGLTDHGYKHTLEFLSSFLGCYPRAASRVLPSVLDTVRMSSQSSPLPQILSNSINFIASKPIVSDSHGAHLAWIYLSPLTSDGVPSATRASIIRILPQMCLDNKKLFRRIRDVIGKSIVSTDPIVRIAATATLSDMAKLDLLRDIEGIVSWIQGRLNDEESTVTYFALSTLRYLVQNEELDFDLVVRVLEKRLKIDLSAVGDFLGWDELALESLIELLGEGGLEEENEDESQDDDDEEEGGPEPTAKTVKAVSLLIELALKINFDDQYDFSTQSRILSKIYQSLSNYSALILGLDPESIRTCADNATSIPKDLIEDWERYLELKSIVQGGINLVTRMQDDEKDGLPEDFSNNLVAMIQLLLRFEEETFGSFVFQKGSSSTKGKNEGAHQHRVSKYVISALPDTCAIKSIYESDESVSEHVAAYFYALGVEDNNGHIPGTSALLAEMTECISYFAPLSDPPSYAMQVFSIINAMGAVFRSIQSADENDREKLFKTAVDQLEEWATEFSEYGYIALSALALAADDSPQFYSGISRVQDTILEGCDMFETEDVKLLCLCMVAARLSQTTDSRVVELLDSVEKSTELHSGQSCFGGHLGLAIFVQSVANKIRTYGSDPSDEWCREQARRCICILVKALDNCTLSENDSILELASCIALGKSSDSFTLPSELTVKDGAAQKLNGVIIALSHCFHALAGVSTDLLKSVVTVILELPWGAGKGFATHSTYKTLIDVGVYSMDDISEAIDSTMTCVQGFDGDCIELLDPLFSLVSLCRLSSGKVKEELELVNETVTRILSTSSRMSSKGKAMAAFTCCASIGELPGVTSFVPNISLSVKKDQVTNVVGMLEGTLLNGEVECTHASALALGVLCSMRNASQTTQQHRHEKKSDRTNVDVNSIIQGKGGTIMEFVLQQVAKAHSDILAQHSGAKHASKQVCILFKALEVVSLPGSFSRVIETALYSSAVDDTELTDSSLRILFSQTESGRRRIGFDGRGFFELSTRLAKLATEDLIKLVGEKGAQQMMMAMPNLLFQLPTSTGEEVAKCLWDICRDLSNYQMVMTGFFNSIKTILSSSGKESRGKSKLSTSPALLRALQNFVANGLFDEFCKVATTQSSKIDEVSSSSYATSISAFLECINLISTSATTTDIRGLQSDVSCDNVFVMASCASFSSKLTRRVETWIARQDARENSSNLRLLLLSSLALAPQCRNEIEMKESVTNLFDIMLVAGIDNTLCMELIAAKIAYWWDSGNIKEMAAAAHPILRVSTMSSFLISSNLCFEVQSFQTKQICGIFDLLVTDLPVKLALLCQTWKISDDISNRATRLCKDATGKKKACLERIIQLLDGGGERMK
eukprot:scaffold7978_cov145-Skeletonema_menzelii.AAC.6